MKRFDLSEIMRNAHRTYKYSGKKQGKTFGEVLKATWRLAKLQENFSQEAMKARTDKFLSERNEVMNKAAKDMRDTITSVFPLLLTTTQIVLITVHIMSEINQFIQ
mgnify:CR=1 FL=1